MKNLIIKGEKISVFFILYTLIFFTFFNTLKYILPFLLAFIFSLLLKTPTQFLIKKFKLNVGISSFISTFIFFFIIIVLLTLFITSLAYESSSLTSYIQEIISTNSKEFHSYFISIQNWLENNFIDNTILNLIKNTLISSIKELTVFILSFGTELIQKIFLLISYLPYTFMLLIFTVLSTYFLSKELNTSNFSKILSNYLNSNYSNRILTILDEIKKMFLTYCFSYLFLIFISFILTFLGFSFLNIKYALLLSVLAALLDLIPILGMPLIYFPLIFVSYSSGNIFSAIFLLILYLSIFLLRQFLEPKLMSSTLGIHPLLTLICIFVGLELNGFLGIIFFIFFIIFFNIFKKVNVL
ncbi:sporulation integral membrane protein YtvI [Clostridium perfringens]|nr:sporulation integral membrane protein YtvI [Clostridium perfringens]